MKILPPYKSFKDKRGSFTGIVNFGEWHELNFVETFSGETRGNHYHKRISELFFIISGEVEVSISSLDGKSVGVYSFKKGDAFIVEPLEVHKFTSRTASEWINVLSEKIDSGSPDIYPL